MKILFILGLFLLSSNSWAVSVLQIGDSHTVQGFGEGLYKSFNQNQKIQPVRSIGLAGASPTQYADANAKSRTLNVGYIDRPQMKKPIKEGTVDQLSTLLNSQKPDIVVIELGDNFASYAADLPSKVDAYAKKNNVTLAAAKAEIHKKMNARVEQQAQLILDQIAASTKKPSECFWIGPTWTDNENVPPYYKTNQRAQEVTDLIAKKISGKCTMVDSMKIIKKSEVKTVDNLHLTKELGIQWGNKAYEDIYKKSKLLSSSSSPSHTSSGENNIN